MSDVNVRIPEDAKDRLAAIAEDEGLSLRAFLARLAGRLLTPSERAERAEQARIRLQAWNGYAPDEAERDSLDAELDRRLDRAGGR